MKSKTRMPVNLVPVNTSHPPKMGKRDANGISVFVVV
jgi:hypothetical protein